MTRSFAEAAPFELLLLLLSLLLPWLNPESLLPLLLLPLLLLVLLELVAPGSLPEPPRFSGTLLLVDALEDEDEEELAPRSGSRPVAPREASTVSLLLSLKEPSRPSLLVRMYDFLPSPEFDGGS